MRIPVYHVRGISPCHFPALYLRRTLSKGETVRSKDVEWPDGRPGRYGEPIACGHCKLPLEGNFGRVHGRYEVG